MRHTPAGQPSPTQLTQIGAFSSSNLWWSLRKKTLLNGGTAKVNTFRIARSTRPQHNTITPWESSEPGTAFGHVFLRRCGDLGLLLVLDGGLLKVLGGVGGGVLLLRDLSSGAGVAVSGLAAVLGGTVGGVGLGFEAVDLGLGFGDVLLRKVSDRDR